jgi:hypothetical protein
VGGTPVGLATDVGVGSSTPQFLHYSKSESRALHRSLALPVQQSVLLSIQSSNSSQSSPATIPGDDLSQDVQLPMLTIVHSTKSAY